MPPREKGAMNQTKARKASYRNGWAIGAFVAFVIIAVTLVWIRDAHDPMDELLLVVVPIGVVLGSFAALAVETPASSRKRRDTLALSILAGFTVYVIVLALYLMPRV